MQQNMQHRSNKIRHTISPRKGDRDTVPSPVWFNTTVDADTTVPSGHITQLKSDSIINAGRESVNFGLSDLSTVESLDRAATTVNSTKAASQNNQFSVKGSECFTGENSIPQTTVQVNSTRSSLWSKRGRPPRPKPGRLNDFNSIRSTNLGKEMITLKGVTDGVSDWFVSITSQMGGCGSASSLNLADEIEFRELDNIIKDAQSQVRRERTKAREDSGIVQDPSSGQKHKQCFSQINENSNVSCGIRTSKSAELNYTSSEPPISIPSNLPNKRQQAFSRDGTDAVWAGVKSLTNFVFSNVGQWVNETLVNSETIAKSKDSNNLSPTLSSPQVPLSTINFSSQPGNSRRKHRQHFQSQPLGSIIETSKSSLYPPFKPSRTNKPNPSSTGARFARRGDFCSRPMSEIVQTSKAIPQRSGFSNQSFLGSLFSSQDSLSLKSEDVKYQQRRFGKIASINSTPIQRVRSVSYAGSHCSPSPSISRGSCRHSLSNYKQQHTVDPRHRSLDRHRYQKSLQCHEAPRLPPPPTPHELICPSRHSLMSKTFRSSFWKEPKIERQPLTLPPPTLWQGLWHSVDVETKKVRLVRKRVELFGDNGPSSRQTFDANDVCDSSPLTWRESWKSHLELTVFSIENAPYIGQVVIDTEGFRLDMPFRAQFVRIPIYHSDQIMTLWFNSAYPRPYRRRRSKLLFTRVISDPSDLSEESDDDEEDVRDALENDFISTDEIISLTMEQLPKCQQLDSLTPYHPQGDWKTYFRLDIPVSAVLQSGVIEDACIVAPQQIFYDNNKETLDAETMFNLLRRESKLRSNDPKIKFCIKCHYQGLKNLVCTGDTDPPHPVSLESHLSITNPTLYDVKRRLYRPIRDAQEFQVHERLVYVGAYDDSIDLQIALELNRNNSELLHATQGHPVERLCKGLYSIYGEEYPVQRVLIDTSTLDLSELHLQSNDSLLLTTTASDHNESRIIATLYLAVVFGENFQQPFHNFIKRTRTNFILTSVDTTSVTGSSSIILPSESNGHEMQPEQRNVLLPNLMLPNSELPWGPQNNPRELFKLTQHAKAILANLKQSQIGSCSTEDDFLIQEHLEPPVIQLNGGSLPVPVTFYWDDNDLSNVHVGPINIEAGARGGIPYLFQLPHTRSPLFDNRTSETLWNQEHTSVLNNTWKDPLPPAVLPNLNQSYLALSATT